MRLLAVVFVFLSVAGPAAAAGPRFALYDLQTDLAQASKNTFGDVQVQPLAKLAGKGTTVHCGAACRFGSGWLAFRGGSRLTAADVASAQAGFSKRLGWHVALTLRSAAVTRWSAFAKHVALATKRRGVPDVFVVVAGGEIAAAPLATQVTTAHGVVTLAGFSRASAKSLAKLLG